MTLSQRIGRFRRQLPAELLGRVQRLFLALNLLMLAFIVVSIALDGNGPWFARAAAVGLSLVLGWRWVAWSRADTNALLELAIEAPAIGLLIAAAPNPVIPMAIVFTALYYRALYSGHVGVIGGWLVYGSTLAIALRWAAFPYTMPRGEIAAILLLLTGMTAAMYGLAVILRDTRQLARNLRSAEHHFRTLVEHIPSVVYLARMDGIVHYISPRVTSMLGYTQDQSASKLTTLITKRVHPEDQARVAALVERAFAAQEPMAFDCRLLHADGRAIWTRNAALPVCDAVTGAWYWYGTITDITEQQQMAAELKHQASHDTLTGLANRALFENRLDRAIVASSRHQTSIAVLFLDIDGFKIINDSLGHRAGDELLRGIAGRLRMVTRERDTLARFGGDEFTLVLEAVEGQHEALAVADRIADQLRAPIAVAGQPIYVTASIGIALGNRGEVPADELIRRADMALYEAKRRGKARPAVFDPAMQDGAGRQLERVVALRRGIEGDELRVFYQPLVDLRTGSIREVEALVRWMHPERGLLDPSQFLPLAEETRLIPTIDRYVLRMACQQVRAWQQRYPIFADLTLCVNLSPLWLREEKMVDDIAATLRETGFPAARLKLEISEHAMIADVEGAADAIRALHALGIRLAIDDFGTGNTALSYLRQFPIDTVKIDRSFVAMLDDVGDNAAMLQAVITLGKTLGLTVTAEDIETHRQLTVAAFGCDLGQGYHFARPLPSDDMERLLERGAVYDLDMTAAAEARTSALTPRPAWRNPLPPSW